MHGVFPAHRRGIVAVITGVLERHDFQIVALFFHAFNKARVDEIRVAFRVFCVPACGGSIGLVNQIKQIGVAQLTPLPAPTNVL